MARLRPIKSVRVLTLEEKTRVANLFMLLVEINLQKGITNKRRSPTSSKTNAMQCKTAKTKTKPIKPYFAKATKGKKESSYLRQASNKASRKKYSSRILLRDLYLQQFARIFKGNIINVIAGYSNDRHHSFNAC